jgi:HSP20 family molecular chaperone IbpA
MSLLNTLSSVRNRRLAAANADRPADLAHTVKPAYRIHETADAFRATVFLPGVAKEGLEVTAEEGVVRIIGRRAWKQPESWKAFHRESVDVPFELVLSHDNTVDPDKIAAELRDGVLDVSLAKHEAVKPRKIAVN